MQSSIRGLGVPGHRSLGLGIRPVPTRVDPLLVSSLVVRFYCLRDLCLIFRGDS